MSKRINVNPDHYKTAGRERPGRAVPHEQIRRAFAQEQAQTERWQAERRPTRPPLTAQPAPAKRGRGRAKPLPKKRARAGAKPSSKGKRTAGAPTAKRVRGGAKPSPKGKRAAGASTSKRRG